MEKQFKNLVLLFIGLISGVVTLYAQTGDLRLIDWKPKSQLVVRETKILQPKFPVIDIHNHLRGLENMKTYLEEMDKAGVLKCVSLDGYSKDDFY